MTLLFSPIAKGKEKTHQLEELKQYIGEERAKGKEWRLISEETGLTYNQAQRLNNEFLKEYQEYFKSHKDEFIASLRLMHEQSFQRVNAKAIKAFEEGEDAKLAVFSKLVIEALREYRNSLREYGLLESEGIVIEDSPLMQVITGHKAFLDSKLKFKSNDEKKEELVENSENPPVNSVPSQTP